MDGSMRTFDKVLICILVLSVIFWLTQMDGTWVMIGLLCISGVLDNHRIEQLEKKQWNN